MNRGGSLRRRLSSLRGAWRWSTGYLFRKVGCKRMHGRIYSKTSCCFFFAFHARLFLCRRKSFPRLPRRLLPAPQRLFPPPFLPHCLALSQMVNLYGLLVKSTSPDVFHLETGPGGPPTQVPSSSSSPTTLHPPLSQSKFPKQMRIVCV